MLRSSKIFAALRSHPPPPHPPPLIFILRKKKCITGFICGPADKQQQDMHMGANIYSLVVVFTSFVLVTQRQLIFIENEIK